ncbi:MAG: lipoprotein-releasing ABC transporter permease subunit [Xanthomonadales bacterium]|nr:lipoprotein-releasing ABC transporter permease subunit [Gammaproteobacteria bacterium]MBT8052791.1 lipoprotein-releasing ABC transporter permease subunit [Gammaproteobacteria bacterium]NND56146.1 lipoprotein-releasing ABC transporter permease subunit [Xanthomonadales bacterium]NNK50551.1 lipoprotein-releasing ABC transporter permease subunit [Xanthomonadales bacterium]
MYKPLEAFIGLRYVRAKRRNHFISFISLTSMLGIALGVTTLITVISVMNGFEKELRARILGAIAHATIQPADGSAMEWRAVIDLVEEHPEVDGAAPYIEEGVWLQGAESSGAFVRGVNPEYEPRVSEVDRKMLTGALEDLRPGEYGIILGIGLASRLRVGPGDRVTVIAPRLKATPVGASPLMRRFTVVGAFEFGEFENDSTLALVHIDDAARLLRMPQGTIGGVRLHLKDMDRAWRVAREISDTLPGYYIVRDWTQERGNLFQAVRTEKTVMWVILSLIIAVAAFNIISMLVMVVTDKQSDIAILKTMGAGPGTVMRIFVIQGSVIGVIGTVMGVVGGILLAQNIGSVVPFLEQLFGFSLFPSDIYYITELPSDLRTADVVKFALMSLVMSLLSTIYPSWRAARTHPAEALSYE